MQGLISWLKQNESTAKTLITAVTVFIAVIGGGWQFIMAIIALSFSKDKKACKNHLLYAAGIVVLSVIGYFGLTALVTKFTNDNTIIPKG